MPNDTNDGPVPEGGGCDCPTPEPCTCLTEDSAPEPTVEREDPWEPTNSDVAHAYQASAVSYRDVEVLWRLRDRLKARIAPEITRLRDEVARLRELNPEALREWADKGDLHETGIHTMIGGKEVRTSPGHLLSLVASWLEDGAPALNVEEDSDV